MGGWSWKLGYRSVAEDMQPALLGQIIPRSSACSGEQACSHCEDANVGFVHKFWGKGLLFCSFQVLIKPKASKYCSTPDTWEPISAGQGG